jgi:hypothetical protein
MALDFAIAALGKDGAQAKLVERAAILAARAAANEAAEQKFGEEVPE